MRFGPIVGSLLGSLGGGRVGRMLGGNAGGMIGSILGSMLGSQGSGMLGNLLGNSGGSGGFGQQQHQNQLQHQSQAQPQQQGNFTQGDGHHAVIVSTAAAMSTASTPSADAMSEAHEEALIVAMCSAAKADGVVEAAEMQTILDQLGDMGAEESAFLRSQLSSPLDLPGLLAQVPKGFEQEIYAVSLLTIAEASGSESAYLDELAQGLGLSPDAVARMKESVSA